MDVFWYALVGVLFAGYLALESTDFGVGMLMPFARKEADRARMRRTVVPLFLANEVWLVAFVGVLFGALPLLEGKLLLALRLPLLVLLCAWLLRDAALWFRAAHPGVRWRRSWDVVLPVASFVLATGWGAVLAVLVRGLSIRGDAQPVAAVADLMHPFTLLCAALVLVASLRQGALFAARQLPGGGELATRLGRLDRFLLSALLVLLVLTAAVGALVLDAALTVAGVLTLAGLCLLLPRLLGIGEGRGRQERSVAVLLLGTAPLLALPVLVATVNGTTVLVTRSGQADLALSSAIADSASLGLLSVTVLPALIAAVVVQWWMWRLFARPSSRPA